LPGIRYYNCPGLTRILLRIAGSIGVKGVDEGNLRGVVSRGSRSTAYARIWALPRPFIVAFGWRPSYVVEVIYERWGRLSCEEKLAVLVHELLHVPRRPGGGLRRHGEWSRWGRLLEAARPLASLCGELEEAVASCIGGKG